MGITVLGARANAARVSAETAGKNYHYDYELASGRKIDLHPSSDTSATIVKNVLDLATHSRNAMSGRYPSWGEIDRNMTSCVTTDADNKNTVRLVVPMSFTIRESLLTQVTLTLLDDVFFPLDPVGPEDELGTILLEAHIQQQMLRSSAELGIHTMFSDGYTYGIGVIAPVFERKTGNKLNFESSGRQGILSYTEDGISRSISRDVVWEGHSLVNIDPYLYLPDPGVPGHKVQDGQFVGWVSPQSRISLLGFEAANPTQITNARYLEHAPARSALMGEYSGRYDGTDGPSPNDSSVAGDNHPVDVIYMYTRIIPSEWGLPSDAKDGYPEMWMFAVANDSIVLCAKPVKLAHGMYPVVVCAPDYDGYSVAPISRMELMWPMQQRIDKIISSHFTNIEKSMHMTYVVDPFRININDVIKSMSTPGGIFRTRRATWGQGVDGAIKQMENTDITRGNIPDSSYLMNVMERVGGAPATLQGAFDDAPERRTAREFSDTRSSSIARANKSIRMAYAMSMRPLGHMLASQTQQYASQESWVKVTGTKQQRLMEEYGRSVQQGRVLVNPQELDVNYDVSSSISRVSINDNPEASMKLFDIAQSNPVLSARIDLLGMYLAVARKVGEVNADRFVIDQQSPEAIQQMLAQGATPTNA